MGHYRSEMGYETDDEKRAAEKAARLAARTKRLQEAIDAQGVAALLAKMIEDETLFRIHYF